MSLTITMTARHHDDHLMVEMVGKTRSIVIRFVLRDNESILETMNDYHLFVLNRTVISIVFLFLDRVWLKKRKKYFILASQHVSSLKENEMISPFSWLNLAMNKWTTREKRVKTESRDLIPTPQFVRLKRRTFADWPKIILTFCFLPWHIKTWMPHRNIKKKMYEITWLTYWSDFVCVNTLYG